MANTKISGLTSASTPLAGTEVLPIVQSGTTVKATVANIVGAGTSPGSFTTIAGTGPVTIKQTSDYPSAGSGVNVVKSNTTDVWTSYVAADTAYSVAYGATLGASNRMLWIDTTGNTTLGYGNLVPSTAGKGINFTANTPASGMTSQNLTWYEEGTWTPAQGSGLTVVGTFSSTGKYTRIGRQVCISGTVSGSTGVSVTAAGVITNNLPFTVGTAGLGQATNAGVNAFSAVICTSTNVTSAGTIASTTTITFSATYFV